MREVVSCLGNTAEQVVRRRSSRVPGAGCAESGSIEPPRLRADRITDGQNGVEWLHLNPPESSCANYTGAANPNGAHGPVGAGRGDRV